jgi:hypothetical protein
MRKSERMSRGSAGMCQYSSTETEGEGFGKRQVGMQVQVDGSFGILIKVTRRINPRGPYYDYWYKVRLYDGRVVWRSHVDLT